MENNQAVYVNTFAEGYIVGEPENITSDNVEMVARSWKRSNTIGHYRFFGTEEVKDGDTRKTFLIGDIGVAKIMLPIDQEYMGLEEGQTPDNLLQHWVSAMIVDYDFQDEANPTIILSRKKALDRMKQINENRLQVGNRVYAVIQQIRRAAYVLNVGGKTAIMPRTLYDYNGENEGQIGECLEVKIIPSRDEKLIVSRRDLIKNPFLEACNRIRKGSRVRVTITYIHRGNFKGQISPGVRVSFSGRNMRRIPKVGDTVVVEIAGTNDVEFYGIIA